MCLWISGANIIVCTLCRQLPSSPYPLYVSPQTSPHSVPLGVAAQEGHKKTVDRLLKGGANINHQDKVSSTQQVLLQSLLHLWRSHIPHSLAARHFLLPLKMVMLV